MNNEVLAFVILSFLPTVETRYTIPLMIASGISPYLAFLVGVFVNAVLATTLAYLLWAIDGIVRRIPLLRDLWVKYLDKARSKVRPYVDKYGPAGLVLFVAIPVPGTGIWTGSLAGYILGIERHNLAFYTFLGGLFANIVTMLFALGMLSLV